MTGLYFDDDMSKATCVAICKILEYEEENGTWKAALEFSNFW